MTIRPYLFFDGRCEEAMDFYVAALGAEVKARMRYRDAPQGPPPGTMPPGYEAKIIHAEMAVGGSIVNLSDGHCAGTPRFEGFGLTLPVADEAAASRAFAALSDGGEVRMPLGKTFFSSCFGMVCDRFGVLWLVIVQAEGAA